MNLHFCQRVEVGWIQYRTVWSL